MIGGGKVTTDQWIASASSIGTLIAATLAFFSIREVRLQREQQFKPQLVPIKAQFRVGLGSVGAWKSPSEIEAHIDTVARKTKDTYAFSLINIGNGVATDVTVHWKVDSKKWIDAVNTISAQSGAGIGVREDEFGMSISLGGKPVAGVRLPEATDQSFDYVLPVLSGKGNASVTVALGVQALLHAYYASYFFGHEAADRHFNPKSEFSFELLISYKDTAGRQYSRTSILSASVLMIAGNNEEGGEIIYDFTPIRTEPPEGDSIAKKLVLQSFRSFVVAGFPLRVH